MGSSGMLTMEVTCVGGLDNIRGAWLGGQMLQKHRGQRYMGCNQRSYLSLDL